MSEHDAKRNSADEVGEAQAAEALARLHDRLIQKTSESDTAEAAGTPPDDVQQENRSKSSSDVSLRGIEKAADVLRMIERVKRQQQPVSPHSTSQPGRPLLSDTSTAPRSPYEDTNTEQDASHLAERPDPPDRSSESEREPGDLPETIGRFQIQRLLGQGGYGLVFQALDPDLQRDVALKVPRAEVLLTAELRTRFLREAEMAAALNHPNIVPVFEAGQAGVICYIAYAFCPGVSLGEWLAGNDSQLDAEHVARLLATLAEAVQHAHSRGVVHRDLKPSNVLLTGEHTHFTPAQLAAAARIADFGLAKRETTEQDATRSGLVLGTPEYLSPEQAEGSSHATGPGADIFALGVVLYELLTGQTPFRRSSTLATLQAIRTEEPAPLSRIRRDTPPDLEAICLKCLEKRPESRYASAAELAADLRRFLVGLPVRARPIGGLTRTVRWCRRNPLLTGTATLALAFLLTGLSAAGYQWRRAEKNLAKAELQAERAQKNLQQAQEAVEQLMTEVAENLSDVPQLRPVQRNLLSKAIAVNRQFLQDNPPDAESQLETLRAYRRMADLHLMLGELDECQAMLQKAISLGQNHADQASDDKARNLSRSIRGEFYRELARCYSLVGRRAQQLSNVTEAESSFSTSLEYLARITAPKLVDEARLQASPLFRSRAILASQTGNKQQAGEYFQRALEEVDEVDSTHHQSIDWRYERAKCLNSLGIHCRSTRRYREAEKHYRASIELLQRLADENPLRQKFRSELAITFYNLGNLLLSQGDNTKAESAYELAGESYERLHHDFPLTPMYESRLARVKFALGFLWKRSGQYDKAETAYQAAYSYQKSLTEAFPDVPDHLNSLGKTINNLSTLYMDTARWEEAREVLNTLVPLREQLVDRYPDIVEYRSGLARAIGNVGSLECNMQNYDRGIELLRQAIDIQRETLEVEPDNAEFQQYLATDLYYIAEAHLERGHYEEAEQVMVELSAFVSLGGNVQQLVTKAVALGLKLIAADPELDEAARQRWQDRFQAIAE